MLAAVGAAVSLVLAEDAAVTRGLDWLQAQVQTNGSLSGESASLAIVEQARTEAAHTLSQAGRTTKLPDLSPSAVSDLSTELLARRMVALNAAGQDAAPLLPALSARANADGGYGSAVGQPSNPLDTSMALLALRAAGIAQDPRPAAAFAYLDAAANADGSYSLGQNAYPTAYVLQAFARYRSSYNLTTQITRTRTALLAMQGQSGYGDAVTDAVATIAIAQSGAPADAAPAVTALKNGQLSDGSWQDDPYVTAVALRALLVAAQAPSTNAGQVVGEVYDASTGLPLGQAQIALSGVSTTATSNASNGSFTIDGVGAGSHTVTVSHAGYQTWTGAAQVTGEATTNLGRIRLTIADDTAALRGRVTDSQTGASLAGVAVHVAGAMTSDTQTAADGHYELLGLPAGQYSITFTRANYQTLSQVADLPAHTAVTFSPALTPVGQPAPTSAVLIGKVLNSNGNTPIAGAQVSVGSANTTSGADGTFSLPNLAAGEFTANVSKSGFDAVVLSGVLANGSNDAGSVFLTETQSNTKRTLIGTVTSSSTGAPIAGVGLTLNGNPAGQTDASGQYRIEDTGTPDVQLTFSAAGFEPKTLTTRLENPGIYRVDATLANLQEGTFQVLNLRAVSSTVAPDETLHITADIANLTDEANPALIMVRVLDDAGLKATQFCGAPTLADPEQCNFDFDPKQTRSFAVDWKVPNLQAGHYTIALHVIKQGSVTRTNLFGLLLGHDSRSIQVKSVLGLQGNIVPSPPVLIPGSPSGVDFTALVQNKGNDTIPAGTALLNVRDHATGTIAYSTTTTLPEMLPNGLSELAFGNWKPTATGAHYDLEVVSTDPTVGGNATGQFYVGDAPTAEFTVTPSETGDGTQRVEATLHVKGIDNPTGQSADPLYALTRQAVSRGGVYAGTNAMAWQEGNQCLGCHIQTQSLYGMASALGKADIDEAAAKYLLNSQTANIQTSRAIYNQHPEYPLTQAEFGLWSLTTWPDKSDSFNARLRVAKYVQSRVYQDADGVHWPIDYGVGWNVEPPAATAIVVEGLAGILRDAQAIGRSTMTEYSSSLIANTPAMPTDLDGGPDGNVYVATYNNEIDVYNTTTGAWSFWAKSTAGTNTVAIAMGPDGAAYTMPRQFTGKPWVLERVTPQGNSIVMTLPAEMESIDFLPDGRAAILDCNHRKLYIADLAAGTLTLLVDGGLLPPQPRAVTALQDGTLMVMGSYNSEAEYSTRVTLGGQQSRIWRGNRYPLTDLAQDADGSLMAGGDEALNSVSANGRIERFAGLTGAAKVTFAKGRLFGVFRDGRSGGDWKFREFVRQDTPIAPDLEKMRQSIQGAASHYVDFADHGLSSQAFRLIVLSEARPYITDASLAARVDARIPQLAAQLRAAQRSNGGFAYNASYAPDSMMTAIVGTALDYTAPDPSDQVLRKTVEFLLANQQPDGSWTGSYFGTRLGATSYVMAYLPRAVARLGGIDVGLGLSFAPNVKLVGSSVNPTTSSLNADGSSDYFFSLGRIAGAEATFKFTLDMVGMAVDEVRKIATNAFLSFVNSFTGETVQAPIGIPEVHAASSFTLDLALDKSEYTASEDVQVQPTVHNNNSSYTSGSLRYFIETSEGAPVAELSTVAFTDIATNTHRVLPQPWNTGTNPAGDYRARVVLLSPEGKVWDEATQPFRILTTSTGAQLSSSVATDHPVYDAFDTVQILGKVRNLTVNSVFHSLSVHEVVTGPANEAVYATDRSIDSLAASTTQSLTVPFNLSAAPVGTYTVTQTVLAVDGSTLDVQVTHFDVRASTGSGSGLTGTVAAVPPTVEQGETTSLLATAKNAGNSAFTALPTVLSVIDPATQTVLATWTQPVDLAVGQSASYSRPWSTAGVAPGAYQVVLQAQLPSGLKTLAYGPVTVIEPQVKVTMAQSLVSTGRVLVLMTCRVGTGSAEDAACTRDRAAYVDAMLTRLGVQHLVVTTTADFAREYATGRYDTYWVSGGAQKLANTLAEEVREAVFQGDGLIVDGVHDSRNQILDTALGVKFTGQLSGNKHAVRMEAGEFNVGTFATPGDALTYVPAGASIQGRFDTTTGSPAFLEYRYGDGHSTVAAYDWVAALRTPATAAQTEDLLLRALHHVLPPVPTYGLAGGYLSVRTDVANQAKAADLLLRSVATAPLKLEDALPAADALSALEARWRFPLAANASRSFRLGLRLPASSGQYQLATTVALASNESVPLASANLTVVVAASRELTLALRDELNALPLSSSSERNARSHVLSWLDQALAAEAAGQRDAAVGYLLKAVDELAKIGSVPTAPYHVQLAVLIKAARVAPNP